MKKNKLRTVAIFLVGLVGVSILIWLSILNTSQSQSNEMEVSDITAVELIHRQNEVPFMGQPWRPQAVASISNSDTEDERLLKWKSSFPWKPTHDPQLKFVPDRHLSDHDTESPMSATDMYTGANHYVLKNFFSDDARFSPQFERFYRILEESDRGHNPVEAARAFYLLRSYHHAAFEHNENDEISSEERNLIGKRNVKTWGQYTHKLLSSLHVELITSEWHRPGFLTEQGRADAHGLIERLLDEVVGLENLPVDVMSYAIVGGLNSRNPEARGLLSGEEELLVPYVGWTEEHAMMEGVQSKQFQTSYEQGDPSLKEVAPELFPPVGVKNGQLVDKDGDPVKWSDSREIALINERGERVPVVVEDDGSISLPTPQEVELMRQNGDVRPATLDEASPIIQKIMEMSQPPK